MHDNSNNQNDVKGGSVNDHPPEPDATVGPQPQSDASALQGLRILVAEDNELNQILVTDLLTMMGATVTIAKNGKIAIDTVLAARTRFDAMLVDVQMPEIDGLMAAAMIRKTVPSCELPIIAMTADATAEEREKSLASGMDDHLTKPINPDRLQSTLRQWTGRNSSAVADMPVVTATDVGKGADLPDHLPPFDIPAALQRLGGRKALVLKLLIEFHDSYADVIQNIRALLADGDRESATRLAHNLKSGSGSLEARAVYECSKALEEHLRTGAADIKMLVDELEAAMEPAIRAATQLKQAQ